MAWDANEKGNPAWLTKQASEHGGVDNFIDDIHDDGYQKGHCRGMIEGAGAAAIIIGIGFAGYQGIKHLIQKHKLKKQAIRERSKSSKTALKQMCEKSAGNIDNENIDIDK